MAFGGNTDKDLRNRVRVAWHVKEPLPPLYIEYSIPHPHKNVVENNGF